MTPKSIMALIIVLATLVSAGCTNTTRLNTGFAPKADDATIEVFFGRQPERPYVEIAVVQTDNAWNFKNTTELVDKLKQEARKVGADAILLTRLGKQEFTYQAPTTTTSYATVNAGGKIATANQTSYTSTTQTGSYDSAEGIAVKWK